MKEESNDLLNQIIKIGKENIYDLEMNSTKFGDIMNNININSRNLPKNQQKTHQKCNTSISNEEFTNQMMKEINTGGLDEIYEILEQDTEESAKKSSSHSRHNTETFDYLRLSNYNKVNNIREFQIDNRKTVDVFDKFHMYEENADDDDDSENNDKNKIYNDEDEGDGDGDGNLGAILGMQLEKFNKENNNIILNENTNKLIDNLKKEYIYVKTGTKMDFVEEIEGNFFSTKRNYKDLEKYISKLDDEKKQNDILTQNKKISKKLIYDILSTKDNIKLYKDLKNFKSTIHLFENNNIFCSTEKGNVLIYNLEEEKKIKELDNPYKDEGKKNVISITSMDVDDKYIVCSYNNGKIALFRKGKDKLTKSKLYLTVKDIYSDKIITEIKIYSGKKDRIIFYIINKSGKIIRTKIFKGMIMKIKRLINKNISINSYNDYPFYNLEINPFNYKCFGICNFIGVFIYTIKKNESKLLYKKIQDLNNNYYPNFCFVNSFNETEKSKFMASINPDSVILCEINSNFTNVIQLNKYMLKDPIIKIGIFMNELVYIFDKSNHITLINCNSNKHKITQKCIRREDKLNLSDKKNFIPKHIEDLNLYNNIICNSNRNILVNSRLKILLITPITLTQCINKICEKKENDKWQTLFYLCQQIYKNKHPIWKKNDYEKCSDLIIEKINICLNEILLNKANDKVVKLKDFVDFLFNVELYDYITSEKDGLFSKLKDNKLYFYLLEPYILQNKMKSISLPIIFIHKLIDFYLDINKKTWLCELLIHFDIKLLCDKNSINKNGITLIDVFDKNNLINIIIYLIIKNYEIYKDYSYTTPIIDILLNLIKESKNLKKGDISNKLFQILSNHNEYNEMEDYDDIINKKEENIDNEKKISKKDFIELNRYNDELLFSNYYLRIKIFWYIYTILFVKGINDNNKKKCQELIDKSLEVILNPKIYEILELNEKNNESLNLDGEIRFFINKLFKDEHINEFCEINKEDILGKIERLVKRKYISQIVYYLICLKSLLDDSTLEINKETKLNMILFFMNKNNYNNYEEIKTEKFENDLIELLKNIDSFTFEDSDKIINTSNLCKDSYPKLYEYIVNNFKK